MTSRETVPPRKGVAGGAGRRLALVVLIPAALGAVTWIALTLGANATTAGFLYLVTVLLLATQGDWIVGAAASVAAVLGYNYFFIPPFGTLSISDPANWVALASFLAASTLASRLVASARRQADEAQRRRSEVETLYDLCFGLFTSVQPRGAGMDAAIRTLRAIGADSGAFYSEESGETGEPVVKIGSELPPAPPAAGSTSMAHEIVQTQTPAPGGESTAWIPLHVGGRTNGLLVARGPLASRAVLEPAGRLLALALERIRLLDEAAHLEAVRQSDALKTSLLRAVSHDLRTPLTAIRLETESLERQLAGQDGALGSLGALAREQQRLARRIDNLLSLARVEAGVARPKPEPVPPGELFRSARETLAPLLAGHEVAARVAPFCPDLWTDPALTLEIVVNLIENAARASDSIELIAAPAAGHPERVAIEVADRGPGLPPGVRDLVEGLSGTAPGGAIGSRSADSAPGGLGLRIARSLAEANGGTLALLDRPGGGTVARLELPGQVEIAFGDAE